jgi:hypothetical protein
MRMSPPWLSATILTSFFSMEVLHFLHFARPDLAYYHGKRANRDKLVHRNENWKDSSIEDRYLGALANAPHFSTTIVARRLFPISIDLRCLHQKYTHLNEVACTTHRLKGMIYNEGSNPLSMSSSFVTRIFSSYEEPVTCLRVPVVVMHGCNSL